jgi:macrolide transport system ATP-binding/permease protein
VSSLRNVAGGLRRLFRKKEAEEELDEELRAYVDMATEDKIKRGMSRGDAFRAVRLERGDIEGAKEMVRDAQWESLIETWFHDLRFGLRMLRRNPGFTLGVVLTLALAIGANTAIFSVANALLLTQLPYSHPERIGAIYCRTSGAEGSDARRNVDGEQWELLRDDAPSLISAISSLRSSGVSFQSGPQAQYVQLGRVSAHYFDVLGIAPMLGRNFTEDEDRPHGPRSAFVSYSLWRTALGANADILGRAILLKGEPYTLVGVLPQNASTPLNADVYIALQPNREGEGQGTNFEAILRLRDNANWLQANSEIDRAMARSTRYQRLVNLGVHVTYYAVPLQQAQTATLQPQVLVLMLAAAFILLIACANLAGLTLVRMLRRGGEMATRVALGASRWQIQRQLWLENLLLGLGGGVAGLAVGFAALRGLLLLLPDHFLPVTQVSLDTRVLAFTFGLSVFTSVLFGMLPARATSKLNLRGAMGSRAMSGASSVRLRHLLIAGEVALTVVLLAAAGLLIRTLVHLETLPPGFNANGVITAKASLDDVRYYSPEAFRKLLDESLAAMRGIPGVQNAAVGLTVPYERPLLNGVTFSDGPQAGQLVTSNEIYATPDYFDTLQIPVLAGRAFTAADGPHTEHVAIVNHSFARKFFESTDPVGHYVRMSTSSTNGEDHTRIVGVVGDMVISSEGGLNYGSEPLTSEEAIYIPAAQMDDAKLLSLIHGFFQPSWIVRAKGPVGGLPGEMQKALASVDPNLPFSGFYDMHDLMAATLAMQRIEVALLVAMASLALFLSAVGIFALVANLVAQRAREIGIRLALGSTIARAMLDVGRSGMAASTLGLLLGLALCAGVLRALRSVLYGVGAYDLPTIAAVVLTLAVVALAATVLPVLRISRIDPASTLREE